MRLDARRFRLGLAAAFAAALLARAAAAVVDARHPLFPPYYYQDERDYISAAALVNVRLLRGSKLTALTPGKELYTHWLALLARRAGPGPIPGRLVNAAAGAAAAALWGWVTALVAGPAAGLAAAFLLALWPSHIFHTAMAIKEAPLALLGAACAAGLCVSARAKGFPRQAALACSAAAALFSAFLRAYLLPVFVAAAVVSVIAAPRGRRLAALAAALWLGGALAAYRPLKRTLSDRLFAEGRSQSVEIVPTLQADAASAPVPPPTSVAGLLLYRQAMMRNWLNWSRQYTGRTPESVLFPDAEFHSVPALAAFAAKTSFYELFMPLPGFYPTEGKLGRRLAEAEGLLLLAVAVLAAAGLRRVRWSPSSLFLAAFFALVVPPTALLEFDLGSASRHRIHYFPFILPFAAAALLPEPHEREEP